MKFFVANFIIALVLLIVTNRSDGCSFTIPLDVPQNEPVYLLKSKAGYTLFEPEDKISAVDENIVLLCPGKQNSLSAENINELTCNRNRVFNINPKSINCTKQVSGDLQVTNEKCADNLGTIFNAGFLINPEFVKLYDICYNKNAASVIYTKHKLNGKAIKYSVKESRRIGFKNAGVPKVAKPENNYKTEAQIARFNKQLGRHQSYFNKKSFLSRGHLTPDADFIFPSAQFATYFYANVHPQFQVVNGGNWVRVETLARKMAADANENIDVYTGVHDVLRVIDAKGDEQPLYLVDGNLIGVPKWTWKVLLNQRTGNGIVFVTLNNPFADQTDVQDLCPNICAQAGFTDKNFGNYRKGYTFCCSIEQFKKVVKVLPSSVNARGLLMAR